MNQIIIAASVLGFLAICAAIFAFCCIRQRRVGKHERLLEDAAFEKSTAELMQYRAIAARERNEKMAMLKQAGVPNPGAAVNRTMSPMPPGQFGAYANSHYAPSVSTSARGFQKY